MIDIMLTTTELEILLRAIRLARAGPAFPDPASPGDEVRINVLEKQLAQALEKHRAATWSGRMKRQKLEP